MQLTRIWLPSLLSIALLIGSVACTSDDDENETSTVVVTDTNSTQKAPKDIEEPDIDECEDPAGKPECEAKPVCTPCNTDQDCGTDKCMKDARGNGFCTRRCNYSGDTVCPSSDQYCRQTGTTTKDFYCFPISGVCEADGLDCSFCNSDDECKDGLTCVRPSNVQPFCARPCDDQGECQYDGMGCGKLKVAGLQQDVCLPLVDGEPTPKCGGFPLDFCQQCVSSGQCAKGGVCNDQNPELGSFCTLTCESDDDCPPGTQCPSGKKMCQPALAGGCQGYLSCVGSGTWCPPATTCYKGECVENP